MLGRQQLTTELGCVSPATAAAARFRLFDAR
jgi:hypothetical protein